MERLPTVPVIDDEPRSVAHLVEPALPVPVMEDGFHALQPGGRFCTGSGVPGGAEGVGPVEPACGSPGPLERVLTGVGMCGEDRESVRIQHLVRSFYPSRASTVR